MRSMYAAAAHCTPTASHHQSVRRDGAGGVCPRSMSAGRVRCRGCGGIRSRVMEAAAPSRDVDGIATPPPGDGVALCARALPKMCAKGDMHGAGLAFSRKKTTGSGDRCLQGGEQLSRAGRDGLSLRARCEPRSMLAKRERRREPESGRALPPTSCKPPLSRNTTGDQREPPGVAPSRLSPSMHPLAPRCCGVRGWSGVEPRAVAGLELAGRDSEAAERIFAPPSAHLSRTTRPWTGGQQPSQPWKSGVALCGCDGACRYRAGSPRAKPSDCIRSRPAQ